MSESTNNLSPAQEKALSALMISTSIRGAAERAEVGERTLRGWLKDDAAFIAAYRHARRLAVESGIGALQNMVGQAAKTLVKALEAKKPSDRIRAALGIIDRATSAIDLWDLAARLEALEQQAAEQEKTP